MTTRPIAMITGGAKRVGRATTLALARAGCDVIITFDRSSADAHATLADAVALGASSKISRAVPLPMSDPHAVERRIAEIASELTALDVLVHNASSYIPTPRASVSADNALAAYHVNALAPLLISTQCAALLERSTRPGGGAVIAMCDIHAMGEHGIPRRDFLAYAMSKAALAELVRTLARELAPKVRVNGVAPGVAAWPDQGHESDAAMQAAYLKNVPLGRAGTPEECAEVVRWLAIDATYITGQIIRFDGGRSMV